MKKLDKEFESSSFKYKQIHRENMFAIYERHHISSEKKHYEAIKIQSHNGYEIAGNKIPPSECYPTSNGYTCLDKKAAYNRLDRMMKEDVRNKEIASKKAERKKSK